ncbi:SGNH/GDSL hydrolase family protein [uncultured Paracoccus sp.]|uniref:SGNH/GDSL hydrolase family protein n=1 Tax=uncultured Paracoccus sp. TaxID=189685 RepID=UPI002596AF90|nr:SGNH/GDSL hydrolase family protein [uncultured Paracoccus sp.]
MPAPTFNLPVNGSAPNQYADEFDLEAGINAALLALWNDYSNGRVWHTSNSDITSQTPPDGTDQISVANTAGVVTWRRLSSPPGTVLPDIHAQTADGTWWQRAEDTPALKARLTAETEARDRQMRAGSIIKLTDIAGTANAITASSGIADLDFPVIGGYTAAIKPVADADGEILLDVDGIGGRRVVDMDGSALPDGYWRAGRVYFLRYTGTVAAGEWRVIAGGFTATDLHVAIRSLTRIQSDPPLIPVVTTDEGQVPVWLKDGDLDAKGMARHLRQEAVKDIVSRVPHGAVVPLITAGDRVVSWLDAKGRFRAFGLPAPVDDTGQPTTAVPVASDGRTLHRLRRKIGLIRAGVPGARLRIAMTGDSWSEMVNIPDALINLLSSRLAPTSGTFAQANNTYLWSGVSVSAAEGWTREDASINSDWPYGTGPDGQSYHATGAHLIDIGGLRGASLRIYTRKWDGSWNWRLNDGTNTTVAEAGATGALTITEVTGLAPGSNNLRIAKKGSGGRVVFCGVLNVTDDPVEVVKVGNAGLTGYRMRDYAPLVGDIWADIDPDLVIINLGTNDYRNGYSTVATYVEGLTAFITMIRSWLPETGILIVVPPQSNGTAVTPLSAYRDAAYRLAIENGCEFLNQLDSWGPYGGGLWADALHLNEAGSLAYAEQIYSHFIGV